MFVRRDSIYVAAFLALTFCSSHWASAWGREGQLWDEMNDPAAWTCESYADGGKAEKAKEGDRHFVRWALDQTSSGKAHFKREASLDFSLCKAVQMDVWSSQERVQVALWLETQAGEDPSESKPIDLKKGWNDKVEFPLNGEFKRASSNWTFEQKLLGKDRVASVGVVFTYPADLGRLTLGLDNVLLVGEVKNVAFDKKIEKTPPSLEILSVTAPEQIQEWGVYEVRVTTQGAPQTLFEPDKVRVSAFFTSPFGSEIECFGVPVSSSAEKQEWLIRCCPGDEGEWRYKVTVMAGDAAKQSEERRFSCQASANDGFIRVSRSDPRFFETDSGRFYYPIGQNVCWAPDYASYFAKMKAAGENWVRIWLCPWHLRLWEEKKLGAYQEAEAARLDGILRLAGTHGLKVQLVLQYHGMLKDQESWKVNPYNADNGGPCSAPGDFFTSAQAKQEYKRFLRYVVTRWAAFPNLLAWELWNEVDLTTYWKREDVIEWHREMAAFLKEIDPFQHLVTTSLCADPWDARLWHLSDIDFVQIHMYTSQIWERMLQSHLRNRWLNKPIFYGEFGADTSSKIDLIDAPGNHLKTGLWVSSMLPMAGTAMPWWWDNHIDPHNLYPVWGAMTAFWDGVDRRNRRYERIGGRASCEGKDLCFVGLLSRDEAFAFIYERSWVDKVRKPERSSGGSLQMVLKGLFPGEYVLTTWAPDQSVPVRTERLAVRDDVERFDVELCPAIGTAIKIQRPMRIPLSLEASQEEIP